MDLSNKLEIYIPENAEVKCVSLRSLPKNVLRQIDLNISGSEAFGTLADPPQAIWICPAIIQNKGQPLTPCTGTSGMKNVSSVLGEHIRKKPGPLQMAFVSSNRDAYHVLKNTMPGRCSSPNFQLPEGSAPKGYQNAVIIYKECVFLSIKNLNQDHRRQVTQKSKPSHQSVCPAVSALSSSNQSQELQTKGKKAKRKVKHLENKQDVTYQDEEDNVSKAKVGHHVHQFVGGVDKVNSEQQAKAAGEQIVVEKPAIPAHFQLQEQEDNIDFDSCDFMMDEDNEVAENMDLKESSSVICNDQNRERRESLCADVPFKLQQSEFDFNALAQEEKIAEMMARLQQRQAALKSLTS